MRVVGKLGDPTGRSKDISHRNRSSSGRNMKAGTVVQLFHHVNTCSQGDHWDRVHSDQMLLAIDGQNRQWIDGSISILLIDAIDRYYL